MTTTNEPPKPPESPEQKEAREWAERITKALGDVEMLKGIVRILFAKLEAKGWLSRETVEELRPYMERLR